jgi:tetratricopeptide (TPR) repeat protein
MMKTIGWFVLFLLVFTVPSFASSGNEFLGDWFVKRQIGGGNCNMCDGIRIERLNKNIFGITAIERKPVQGRYCFSDRPLTVDFQNDALIWEQALGGKLRITLKEDDDALMELNGGTWILTKGDPRTKAEEFINRGRDAGSKNNYEEAIKEFSQALKIDPSNTTALDARSNAYFRTKQTQLAVQDLDRVINIDPKNDFALMRRGILHAYLDQYQLALQDYQQSIKLNPEKCGGYTLAANAAMELGMYHDARSYLKQGEVRAKTDNDIATVGLALAWLSATSPDKSQIDGEKAVALAERAIETWKNKKSAFMVNVLAAAYARNNQMNKATVTQEEAIALVKSENVVKPETIKRYEYRLELYRSGKPYTWTKIN